MRQMNKSKKQKTLKESIKNFIRGRWFPLIVGIICLVLVAFVMSVFGWRITYAPELENSWSAISAFADWVGVFVSAIGVISSFVAIWYAIQVPKEIADRQDKIALFEKRLTCYEMLETQRLLYFSIKDEDKIDLIKSGVALAYGADCFYDFDKINFPILVDKISNQCTQMCFLFDGIEYREVSELAVAFGAFVSTLYSADKEKVYAAKTIYIKKLDDFIDKHIEEMSRYLFVSKF